MLIHIYIYAVIRCHTVSYAVIVCWAAVGCLGHVSMTQMRLSCAVRCHSVSLADQRHKRLFTVIPVAGAFALCPIAGT